MKHLFWLLSVCLVLAGGTATAQAGERSAPAHLGLGVASFALTLPYGLVKTAYALAGSVTGGLAWAFTGGRCDVARAIVQPAIRGDYVVVPENLTSERALVFVGRAPEAQSSYDY